MSESPPPPPSFVPVVSYDTPQPPAMRLPPAYITFCPYVSCIAPILSCAFSPFVVVLFRGTSWAGLAVTLYFVAAIALGLAMGVLGLIGGARHRKGDLIGVGIIGILFNGALLGIASLIAVHGHAVGRAQGANGTLQTPTTPAVGSNSSIGQSIAPIDGSQAQSPGGHSPAQ
jgi:hypothetical protein